MMLIQPKASQPAIPLPVKSTRLEVQSLAIALQLSTETTTRDRDSKVLVKAGEHVQASEVELPADELNGQVVR
jgi:hypothetical protein